MIQIQEEIKKEYNDRATKKLLKFLNDEKISFPKKTLEIHSLLENGANPDIQNKHGETLLILAIKKGNSDIIDISINYKPNPAITDKEGRNALFHSVIKGHRILDSIRYDERIDINAKDIYGKKAIDYTKNRIITKILTTDLITRSIEEAEDKRLKAEKKVQSYNEKINAEMLIIQQQTEIIKELEKQKRGK